MSKRVLVEDVFYPEEDIGPIQKVGACYLVTLYHRERALAPRGPGEKLTVEKKTICDQNNIDLVKKFLEARSV